MLTTQSRVVDRRDVSIGASWHPLRQPLRTDPLAWLIVAGICSTSITATLDRCSTWQCTTGCNITLFTTQHYWYDYIYHPNCDSTKLYIKYKIWKKENQCTYAIMQQCSDHNYESRHLPAAAKYISKRTIQVALHDTDTASGMKFICCIAPTATADFHTLANVAMYCALTKDGSNPHFISENNCNILWTADMVA